MAIYHSAKTMAEYYDISLSTAKTIIREIRQQIALGRYPPTAILDNCGTRVREDVLIDFLHYRKALKNEVARQYVEPFEEVNT